MYRKKDDDKMVTIIRGLKMKYLLYIYRVYWLSESMCSAYVKY